MTLSKPSRPEYEKYRRFKFERKEEACSAVLLCSNVARRAAELYASKVSAKYDDPPDQVILKLTRLCP